MSPFANLGVHRIVRNIADACARWANADYPPRVRILDAIVARTHYSLPVVEYALDALFASITEPGLHAVLAHELGSSEVLDRFVLSEGFQHRATPCGKVCIISSSTTIGVAILPLVFALIAKCEVVVKDREDKLITAFLATLAQQDAVFARAATAQQWSGADHDLQAYNAIVAFGDDATLAQIRAQSSADTRFIGFGNALSAGYVATSGLSNDQALRHCAMGAARDLLLYDTQGCMSLHLLFVERGGRYDAHALSRAIQTAAEQLADEFPKSSSNPRDEAHVASVRALTSLRSAQGAGALLTAPKSGVTLIVHPPRDAAPLLASRSLVVLEIEDVDDACAYLSQHKLRIEAIALAGNHTLMSERLAVMQPSRICAFGELQRPPLHEPHGGRPRILDFVHLTVAEPA